MVALILVPVLLAAVIPAAAQDQAQLQPTPLSLLEALRLALQQNQQLKVAAFEVAVARAQLAQARAGGAIQGNVQASYARTQEGVSVTIPTNSSADSITIPAPAPNIYDARLVLQYPLYSGGGVEAQIAMAEANLKGAEATFERIRQQIIFTIRQAYYQLLLAQAALDSANHSVTQAAENLRVARARVASGVSPKFDEVQADVALATARQTQVRARNGLAQGMQALNGLLNLPLETPLTPTNPFMVAVVETPLDRLVSQGLETRPELAEVRARQAAAQAGIQLAESGARLNLGLSGAFDYSNTSGFGPGPQLSSTWSVALAATLNVSDGGLTKDRVDEARQRLEQLKAAEVQQRQVIELDVRQSYLNLQSAREELTGADALQAQAAEALRIANVRFAAGVGTSLEVLSAQAASSQAEVAKAQAFFTYNVARAALVRAAVEALLTQARAQIESAAAALEAGRASLRAAEANVQVAETNLARAESDLQRLEALYRDGAVSAQQLDTARSAVKAAEAQRDAARAQRDAARVQLSAAAAVVEQARAGLAVAEANRQTIAIREQDVAAARAQLAQARAVLQQAEILRGNTILTAPFAGVVVAKHVEIGDLVAVGAPVLTIADLSQPYLRVFISETDLGRVTLGQPVDVRVDAFRGRVFHGTVMEISDHAEFTPGNVQTREERVNLVFAVNVQLSNQDGVLKPGLPADAAIVTGAGSSP